MRNYKYILWDWDGCIAKTLHIWLQTYKDIFSEYGIYPHDKEVINKVMGNWEGPKELGIKDIEEYTQKLLTRVNSRLPNVKLYKNVEEFLKSFKRNGKKQALLTTSKKSSLFPALEKKGLRQYFEVVLTSEDVSEHKPNPEIINKAIKRLKAKKEETIIIGDNEKDIEAAKKAGIDSILYHPKENKKFYDMKFLKTFKPTYMIKNFKELNTIIKI